MTSFVHLEYPDRHPGVERVVSVVNAAQRARRGFDSAKGLATMLLAAIAAALLVAADQVVGTWADGDLLLAWIALWAVGFAAIALFGSAARGLSARIIGSLDAWSQRLAKARADERLWAAALNDARIMNELQAAISRNDAETVSPAPAARAVPSSIPSLSSRKVAYYF